MLYTVAGNVSRKKENELGNISTGKKVLRIALSLIMGLAMPFVMMYLISARYPAVPPVMLLTAALAGSWGPYYAVTLCGAALITSFSLLGPLYGWMMLTGGVLPAAAWMLLRRPRLPFRTETAAALLSALFGMLISMLICRAETGGDIVHTFAEAIRGEYATIPREMLESLAELTERAGGIVISVDEFVKTLGSLIDEYEIMYGSMLPGMLVSGSILAGISCVFISHALDRKRGADESDAPAFARWQLPYGMAFALLIADIALKLLGSLSAVLAQMYYCVYYIAFSLFFLKAVSFFSEKYRAFTTGKKTLFIVMTVLLFLSGTVDIVAIIFGGAVSLFGKGGDLYRFIQKRNEKNGGTME